MRSESASPGGISRWRQIGDALIDEIASGALAPGRKLPASEELAARFGVNRHTVLRAISHLQAEGVVRVDRGRGTFVVEAPFQYQLGARKWFEENLLEQRHTPRRTVLSAIEVPAAAAVAAALKIKPRAPVLLVAILGEADGFPVNLGHHHFPLERLPGITAAIRGYGDQPTTKLSFTTLFRRVGVGDFRRKAIRIRSRMPSQDEARRLKMALSDHVLETEVTNVDPRDVPVVYANTCFCASRVEFVINL
jgi:GntR family phosphonate transport system transcriptional regulator